MIILYYLLCLIQYVKENVTEVTGAVAETICVAKEREIVIMMKNVYLGWNAILMDGGEEITAELVICFTILTNSNRRYDPLLLRVSILFNLWQLGPNTRNYAWADWEDWSECSVECGGDGTKTRTRACIPPSNGGFDCPTSSQTKTESCNNGPCPSI